jgi:hypothetical protein
VPASTTWEPSRIIIRRGYPTRRHARPRVRRCGRPKRAASRGARAPPTARERSACGKTWKNFHSLRARSFALIDVIDMANRSLIKEMARTPSGTGTIHRLSLSGPIGPHSTSSRVGGCGGNSWLDDWEYRTSMISGRTGAELACKKPSDRVRRPFARAWSRVPLRSIPGADDGVPNVVLRS